MKQYGIETLKEDLLTTISVAEKVDQALDDDRISILEGIGIAMKSIKMWKIAKHFKDTALEYTDLDDEEREELKAFIAIELDLRNDAAEHVIEQIFSLLIQMSSVISAIKN